MVQQEEVGDRAASRGHVQPAGPAARQRRRQQGGRRRPRSPGARPGLCLVRLSDRHHHRFGPRSEGRGGEGEGGGAGGERAWVHCDAGAPERGRGVAVQLAGACLCQCAPAVGPYAEPGASDAFVLGLGRARAKHARRRAALAVRSDQRLDPVPPLHPCRRCRAHADRRADRGRQVGAARAAGDAVPPLPRRAGRHVRQGLVGARGGARHGRHPP